MKAIISFLSSIVDFIKSFFENCIGFFGLIAKGISALPSYMTYLSSFILIFVVAIVSIAVVTRIIGRE